MNPDEFYEHAGQVREEWEEHGPFRLSDTDGFGFVVEMLQGRRDTGQIGSALAPGAAPAGAPRWQRHVTDDELALLAALALVRRVGELNWPPPDELVDGLLASFSHANHRRPHASDEAHRLRAAEFAVAYLLGWGRPFPPPPGADVWFRQPRGAVRVLRRVVGRAVWRCLRCIDQANTGNGFADLDEENWGHGVPGVPALDADAWTRVCLGRFLDLGLECDCWERHLDYNFGSPVLTPGLGDLRACCRRLHRVSAWEPRRQSFWAFCTQAMQGFSGRIFDPARFPAGLLHAALWADNWVASARFPLVPQPVAFRLCAACGRSRSRTCHAPDFDPRSDHVTIEPGLVRVAAGQRYDPTAGAVQTWDGQPITAFRRCGGLDEHLIVVQAGLTRCPVRATAGATPTVCAAPVLGSDPHHAYLSP